MLKISWPEYNHYNFQEYQVYVNNSKVCTINSASTNYYLDSIFAGQHTNYFINIKAANNTRTGLSRTFSDSLRLLSLSTNEQGKIVFEWEQFKYYYNFNSYKIVQDDNIIVAVIPTVETSTYVGTELPFGKEFQVSSRNL